MSGDTLITVAGNLADTPELRYTSGGAPVASFVVMSTPRFFDKQAQEWRDGTALAMRCNVWRQQAESATESLNRGDRVVVTGKLRQRSYHDREGNKRTVVELEVDEVAASLKFASVKVNKVSRGSDQSTQHQTSDDPWGSAPAPATGDEPPF